MKRYIVAANWKMNKNVQESILFADNLSKNLLNLRHTDIILCPPFTSLFNIGEILSGTGIDLGAQNMFYEPSGAFTGEISADMLKSTSCKYVILGHSERRHIFNESDSQIHKKLVAALNAGLKPILCVGEKLDERQNGQTVEVLKRQYTAAFANISAEQMGNCVIAYEPVWAIGTGVTATREQASQAHREIRIMVAEQFNEKLAENIVILYGGSVKQGNARELIEAEHIDGFLVGGASLVEDQFLSITQIVEEYLEEQEK
ncbi:MAG TPA: triose-phosphate isomerase [Candidatus Marinimicrobia bacterium]|nr:triose-phosphate isomerase [Candidatus Neomarinimicrobiota bacterium]